MRYYIHLLNYNSYYNRQLKREETLDDYLHYEIAPYQDDSGNLRDINIKIGDGVSCKTEALFWKHEEPNYCILEDRETGNISRWFVMEFEKNIGGQYIATLFRDALAEEKENIINNFPIYIEKGYIGEDNPLILNRENFSCNQIKNQEIKLYDKSGIPWIVIYCSNYKETSSILTRLNPTSGILIKDEIISGADIESCLSQIDSKLYSIYNSNIVSDGPISSGENYKFIKYDYNYISNLINLYNEKYVELNISGTFKFYKLHFETFFDVSHNRNVTRLYFLDNTWAFGKTLDINLKFVGQTIFLPYSDFIIDKNIIKNICKDIQLNHGNSVVFDAQVLPYNPYFGLGELENGINRYISLGYYEFDPLEEFNNSNYMGKKNFYNISYEESGETKVKNFFGSSFVNGSELSETFTIRFINPWRLYRKKILKNLYNFRLCSPNYNGNFDFNIADFMKNYQESPYLEFNVDVNYKPYTPYIHVNPVFSGLYGNDYNDARGLICGGDFSLEQASDAWANYKLQNKNYQIQFDRQIQNMEVNKNLNRINSVTSAISGTITGAAGGALIGGPIGATIGGALSSIGGIADININELRYNETLDYTRDMFNYSLQNIQAIPYSITKVSSINSNNKLVPTLEVYKCTEEEEKAFENKIKYNGFTINVIGNFKDYILQGTEIYLKGKLIRYNSDSSKDNHYIKVLSEEINKGFYYK